MPTILGAFVAISAGRAASPRPVAWRAMRWIGALALFLSSMATHAQCVPGEVSASTGGESWGSLTSEITETDGKKVRRRTNSGVASSIAQGWVPLGTCNMYVDVSLPSVPGRSPGSFGWGESRAFASATVPRGGVMVARVSTSDIELISGEHNGQIGPQVEFLVDGVAVPVTSLELDGSGYYSHRIEMRVGAGLHSVEVRAKNVRRIPMDFFTAGGDLDASASLGFFLDPPRAGDVKDVDRFGELNAGLPSADVSLLFNGATVASTQTLADGGFNFAGVDPAELFDLKIEKGGLLRTYQAISLSALPTLPISLPTTLRARLDTELTKLETTPTLISAYDTATARRLAQDWNRTQPELPQVHADRDRALARLLVASEGLAGLFTETAPVATDTAKLTVDTITSMLSARKVVDELGSATARRGAELAGQAVGTVALRRLELALEFLITALKGASEKLQAVVVDAVKSVLPPWAADLFEQSLKLISGTVLEAFSSGEWKGSDARAGLLEAITTELSAQIGGRVLASGYVLQTKEDLDIAAIKARRLDGSGAVVDACGTTQARVIDVALAHQNLLALNATLGDTAKGWSSVADVSILIGRRPGGQLIATLGAVIKGVSAGALTGLSVANYLALYDTAFEQAPGAVRDAFGPVVRKNSLAHRARVASRETKALPSAFADRLAALRAALETAIDETAVVRGEELLAAGAEYNQALQLERLRLFALSTDTAPPALKQALARLAGAEGVLSGERTILYAHLGGLFEPEFADPALTLSEILAQFDAVGVALTALDAALIETQTEAQGLLPTTVVFVAEHGLMHPTAQAEAGPGPFTLRAELLNAGVETAQAVQVVLELDIEGEASHLVLLDSLEQAVGDLAPGERHSLSWHGEYRNLPGARDGLIVHYRIVLQPLAGRGEIALGTFALEPGRDRVFEGGFE